MRARWSAGLFLKENEIMDGFIGIICAPVNMRLLKGPLRVDTGVPLASRFAMDLICL